jgi:hypothetical protein
VVRKIEEKGPNGFTASQYVNEDICVEEDFAHRVATRLRRVDFRNERMNRREP